MTNRKITATVPVQATFTVELEQPFSPEETIGNIARIADRDAKEAVRNFCKSATGVIVANGNRLRIGEITICEPTIRVNP